MSNDDYSNDGRFDRRMFLGAGIAAATSLALAGEASAHNHAGDKAGRVPGIQLYTVRDSMAQDPRTTIEAIGAIGYKELEFAGYYDIPPAELRRFIESLGMTSPNSHIDARQMRTDPASLLGPAAELGNRYATIAWMPEEDRKTLDDWKGWAEALNRAGEVAKSFGMRAAYHNHDFEFVPIDGRLPYDVLLSETDENLVDFELDFFWVQHAGGDIADVLAKAPARFTMAHIKDMNPAGEMVDVGAGEIDFAGILESPAASGLQHLFVEHDTPQNSFRTAIIGYRSLAGILS